MNQSIAETLRVIAASKSGAVALCIGPATIDYGEIILQGLDMYSRLIINVGSHPDMDGLEQKFRTDIRAAVHTQDSLDFLNDVSHHRFELVVIDCAVLHDDLFEVILKMSPVGGFIVLLGCTDIANSVRGQLSSNCFHNIIHEDCLVATRIASNHRPSRKGGRRSHRSADSAT
ncbi:MAG: hypothetical protein OER96_04365 [Gammaproteobacteria bacterium]|nr:hypothetical protein [Gammaproteobacteria bacterium]